MLPKSTSACAAVNCSFCNESTAIPVEAVAFVRASEKSKASLAIAANEMPPMMGIRSLKPAPIALVARVAARSKESIWRETRRKEASSPSSVAENLRATLDIHHLD